MYRHMYRPMYRRRIAAFRAVCTASYFHPLPCIRAYPLVSSPPLATTLFLPSKTFQNYYYYHDLDRGHPDDCPEAPQGISRSPQVARPLHLWQQSIRQEQETRNCHRDAHAHTHAPAPAPRKARQRPTTSEQLLVKEGALNGCHNP
jgi:hypothetical protein